MRAIRIEEWGGPEVLRLVEDQSCPEPGEGEALVHVTRAGINFADTHARENSYLARYELPLIPGAEVAGTTEDGRRVAAMVGTGGYAEYVAVPEELLVPIPDGVFGLPAYPTADVVDPTGAGDTFAGGFMGYVAAHADEEVGDELLRRAMAYGTALASFNVEAFGTERMQTLTPDEVTERVAELQRVTRFDASPVPLRA